VKNNGISPSSPTVLPAAERREGERSEADRSSAAGKTVFAASARHSGRSEVVADGGAKACTPHTW